MNTLSRRHNIGILAGLCLLALIVAAWGYLLWNPATPPLPTPIEEPLILNAPIIGGTDPHRGSKTADITIVEFGDYLCPSCVELHESLQKIMASNPRIKLVWKDMPNTRLNPLAKQAAAAARCAGMQAKYWEFHDALFRAHDTIIDTAAISAIADTLQLNRTSFDACMTSPTIAQMIDLTIAEGQALGVDATPYFFIGKARGAFDERDIKNAIDQAMNTKN